MARKRLLDKKTLGNWKVALLFFLGAATFWLFNELNKEYTTRLIYPLQFNFDRSRVVVMKPLPETLKIDVTGGGWNLLRRTFILFNPTPVTIAIDNPTLIKYYTRATLMFMVTEQLSELTVNYVLTDTIYFDIEEKRSKLVRVQPDSMNIDMRENYRLTSGIQVLPDTVEIIGPKSIIDTLSSPYLFPLEEEEIDDDFNERVEVGLARPDVTIAIPEKVKVRFEVDRFDRITVPVTFDALNFPADSSVYPEKPTLDVSFTVREADRQDEYKDTDFGITVDYNLLDLSDSTAMTILIYAPEEATELDVEPEMMKVIFKE